MIPTVWRPDRPGFQLLNPFIAGILVITLLTGCGLPAPKPAPFDPTINLDAETQAMIAKAQRTVFLIPFSHWDTDWHETYAVYARRADQNILSAIRLAKENPRFRYALEQVLFVQHFWETHPESRADLITLVQKRQITFAWAGITQPETSLAGPAVQWHNLRLGKEWITDTFGEEYIPNLAWQSDAFGNSAALPVFLAQAGITRLFLGRWRQRCNPDDADCQPLPHAFFWRSPLVSPKGSAPKPILTASLSYPTAWGSLLNKEIEEEQIAAFQAMIDEQFARTTSRYLFVPYGFDFLNPSADLIDLVERWNAANQDTVLAIADPETAFHYLATQDLPMLTIDLNPLWQGFYGTRPYARIADKESEFYLGAANKFGLLLEPVQAGDWQTAAINTHYDNISAVGYDRVWQSSQRPRFAESVRNAAEHLSNLLASIAGQVRSDAADSPPILIFNSLSWERGGVVEVSGKLPETIKLSRPQQRTGPGSLAFYIAPVPPIGYRPANPPSSAIIYPVSVREDPGRVSLANGLVAVSLEAARGGAFSSLSLPGQPPVELLRGSGDELVYIEDSGDVYGAFFGQERAHQNQVSAQLDVLATGPLLGRVQAAFSLGGQPITKTVTLRADSPLIEVTLQMMALPETTALIQIPTILQTDIRTDDLGFAALEHQIDTRPIQPGDVTYRRKIFYPITYWSDVSDKDYGLSLITHGLLGVGGTGKLYLLLARSVSDLDNPAPEGVTDTERHTLRYAYYPHRGGAATAQPWLEAYAFNQPLIPVWWDGDQWQVQLPFQDEVWAIPFNGVNEALPTTLSLAEAESGVLVDLYHDGEQVNTLLVDYDPASPATIEAQGRSLQLPVGWFWKAEVEGLGK
jgi:hypothetical protein